MVTGQVKVKMTKGNEMTAQIIVSEDGLHTYDRTVRNITKRGVMEAVFGEVQIFGCTREVRRFGTDQWQLIEPYVEEFVSVTTAEALSMEVRDFEHWYGHAPTITLCDGQVETATSVVLAVGQIHNPELRRGEHGWEIENAGKGWQTVKFVKGYNGLPANMLRLSYQAVAYGELTDFDGYDPKEH